MPEEMIYQEQKQNFTLPNGAEFAVNVDINGKLKVSCTSSTISVEPTADNCVYIVNRAR